MPQIAIVGAGLIGRPWAIAFARAGWLGGLTDTDGQALHVAVGAIRTGVDELATPDRAIVASSSSSIAASRFTAGQRAAAVSTRRQSAGDTFQPTQTGEEG